MDKVDFFVNEANITLCPTVGYSKARPAKDHIDSTVSTCSLTLAVSRGNVTMSAIQAAAPALAIFTPKGGGTSEGLSPTMFPTAGTTGTHPRTEITIKTTNKKISVRFSSRKQPHKH